MPSDVLQIGDWTQDLDTTMLGTGVRMLSSQLIVLLSTLVAAVAPGR